MDSTIVLCLRIETVHPHLLIATLVRVGTADALRLAGGRWRRWARSRLLGLARRLRLAQVAIRLVSHLLVLLLPLLLSTAFCFLERTVLAVVVVPLWLLLLLLGGSWDCCCCCWALPDGMKMFPVSELSELFVCLPGNLTLAAGAIAEVNAGGCASTTAGWSTCSSCSVSLSCATGEGRLRSAILVATAMAAELVSRSCSCLQKFSLSSGLREVLGSVVSACW